MPIVIDNTRDGGEADTFEDIALFDENEDPTLEAEVMAGFFEHVDFDDVMDSDEAEGCIELEDGWFKENEEKELVPCDESDEGAQLLVIETLDGEVAAALVDEDDLFEMFKYYVTQLPEEDLNDKARKAVFAGILDDDEEGVDEGKGKGPFKKGSFRKMHKAGGATQVNRMLGAMMNKQAIKRAKAPGKGYKKGDYTRAGGYASGTASGIKKWKTYKTAKSAQLAKEAKKAKKGKKVGMKKVGLKAAPKKGSKAKASALAKGKGKKKKAKKLSASEQPKKNAKVLSEGATLAAGVLGKMKKSTLVEDKKDDAK